MANSMLSNSDTQSSMDSLKEQLGHTSEKLKNLLASTQTLLEQIEQGPTNPDEPEAIQLNLTNLADSLQKYQALLNSFVIQDLKKMVETTSQKIKSGDGRGSRRLFRSSFNRGDGTLSRSQGGVFSINELNKQFSLQPGSTDTDSWKCVACSASNHSSANFCEECGKKHEAPLPFTVTPHPPSITDIKPSIGPVNPPPSRAKALPERPQNEKPYFHHPEKTGLSPPGSLPSPLLSSSGGSPSPQNSARAESKLVASKSEKSEFVAYLTQKLVINIPQIKSENTSLMIKLFMESLDEFESRLSGGITYPELPMPEPRVERSVSSLRAEPKPALAPPAAPTATTSSSETSNSRPGSGDHQSLPSPSKTDRDRVIQSLPAQRDHVRASTAFNINQAPKFSTLLKPKKTVIHILSEFSQIFGDQCLKCFAHLWKFTQYFELISNIKGDQLDEESIRVQMDVATKLKLETPTAIQPVVANLDELCQKISSRTLEGVLSSFSQRVNSEISQFTPTGTCAKIHASFHTNGRYLELVRSKIMTHNFNKISSLYYLTNQIMITFEEIESDNGALFYLLSLISTFFNLLQIVLSNLETILFLNERIISKTTVNLATKNRKKKFVPSLETRDNLDMDAPGKIDDLIARIIPNTQRRNAIYAAAVIVTSPVFCMASVFVDKLLGRFFGASAPAQVHITQILYEYICSNYFLLDEEIVETIKNFIDLASQRNLQSINAKITQEVDRTDLFEAKPFLRNLPTELHNFEYSFLACEPKAIAEQLTLIEMSIYQNIKPIEFLDLAWSKESMQCIAKNVIELVERANKISFWVSTCILLQTTLKKRTQMLIKFLQVCQCLLELQNFNSLMGIIVGFNMSCTSRLKHSLSGVPSKSLELLEDLQNNLLSPTSSFKNLRAALETSEGFVLPYIGLHLSDITFTEEGNPSTLQHPETGQILINFSKHQMIYNCIHQFLKYQSIPNKRNLTQKDPLFTFLFELPALQTEELYQLSLEREPRGATIKDLE